MHQRMGFVAACLRDEAPMSALCAAFGISRRTGYKWLARYRTEGPEGLHDRSRAPHRHGRRVAPELAEAILALRRDRPYWGPRKLRAILQRQQPEVAWPAASSMGDLLRGHGLCAARRRRRSLPGPPRAPFAAIEAPNDLWCIDFKGWFRTADGTRCDPLTITDAHSRYVLMCRIVAPQHGPVEAAVGVAFALERIDAGKPQQNGRHERFHLTLKQETSAPPAATAAAQQARFDAFCRDFNRQRPHEALDQQPPASLWRPSPRRPPRQAAPWYDAHHAVRKVRPSGEIKWSGHSVFISETLAGEPVGIAETIDGTWLVRYAHIDLGIIDPRHHRLIRFAAARSVRHKANTPRTLLPM